MCPTIPEHKPHVVLPPTRGTSFCNRNCDNVRFFFPQWFLLLRVAADAYIRIRRTLLIDTEPG